MTMLTSERLAALADPDTGDVSAAIYTDEEVYRRELDVIFRKSWLFLGHESQLRKPGDFFTSYMAEDSVVVTRNQAGDLSAFLNVCRHRGMKICRAELGNTRAFQCTYHGWSYGLEGQLKAVPHQESYGPGFDLEDWGAIRVPRVESYKGMIFATWDEGAVDLVEFLGESAYYLDGVIDRLPGGSEVIGGIHKWVIDCNWKMPAEQFASDMYHAATSHVSAISVNLPEDFDPLKHSMDQRDGVQYWSDQGHGGGYFFADRPNPAVWLQQRAKDWLSSTYEEVEARLGADRAAHVSGHNTLFPNFSWLAGTNTIRVWHPRGPGKTEVWAWTIVDTQAPEEVKNAFRKGSLRAFGPSGLLEQDDGENWVEIQKTMQGSVARDTTLCYRMALDAPARRSENSRAHEGPIFSDTAARNFYRRWSALMAEGLA
jgi:3-phenylpropionate/trans-cinnamate dioxygenase subunit alpha